MSTNSPILSSQDLLDQAYEEYCLVEQANGSVCEDEFLDRFPAIRSSLARLLMIHHAAEQTRRPSPAEWPAVGETYRGFSLLAKLGDGAFSRVYLATEDSLGHRLVALKLTRQSIAEAFTLGRLNHPNITPVHSAQLDPDTDLAAICMPYLGCGTLQTLLDIRFALPSTPSTSNCLREAARDRFTETDFQPRFKYSAKYWTALRDLFIELGDSLAFLHDNWVVHQDLKPTNVLLRSDGSPILLDFNLADDPKNSACRFGGTYLYMAPEQIVRMETLPGNAAGTPDPRSDIFSLGVMLYQILTGRHPFGPVPAGYKPAEVRELMKERHRQPPHFQPDEERSIPSSLRELAIECLQRDVERRPTAVQFADRLRQEHRVESRRRRAGFFGVSLVVAFLLLLATRWAFPPVDPQKVFDDAKSATLQDRRDEAEPLWSRYIEGAPRDYRGWLARSMTQEKGALDGDEDRLVAALSDAQSAYRLQPTPEIKEWVAYISHRLGDLPRAEVYYRDLLARGHQTEAVNNNLGAILLRSKRWHESLAFLEKSLEINPDSISSLGNRAQYFQDRFEQSVLNTEQRVAAESYLDAALRDYKRLAETSVARPKWLQRVAWAQVSRWHVFGSPTDDVKSALNDLTANGSANVEFFKLERWQDFFRAYPDARPVVFRTTSLSDTQFSYLVRPAVTLP